MYSTTYSPGMFDTAAAADTRATGTLFVAAGDTGTFDAAPRPRAPATGHVRRGAPATLFVATGATGMYAAAGDTGTFDAGTYVPAQRDSTVRK